MNKINKINKISKAFEDVTRGLIRNAADFPPQNSAEEAKQIELWQKFIEWEKTNPSHVADEASIAKVISVYEECLVLLGHNSDIWLDAALFCRQSSKLLAAKGDRTAGESYGAKTVEFFERATEKLKDSVLLHFAYAEFEEERAKFDKVHEIYNKLIAIPDCDPTLTFVQYMKFARRAESVQSGRAVFKKAREDARTTYHVYVAAALTEFYRNKNQAVAVNVFELGLKKYANNSDYILAYVGFLSHLNEDGNLRALFERVLASGSLPPYQSVVIWEKFVEFESNFGNLTSVLDVERRRAEHKFEGNEMVPLAKRCKFMDLQVVGGLPKPVGGLPKPAPAVAKDVFSMPVAARLLSKLPPPLCFRGPFVNVAMCLNVCEQWQVPVEKESKNLGQSRSQSEKRSAAEIESLPGGVYASRMKKKWKAEGLLKPE